MTIEYSNLKAFADKLVEIETGTTSVPKKAFTKVVNKLTQQEDSTKFLCYEEAKRELDMVTVCLGGCSVDGQPQVNLRPPDFFEKPKAFKECLGEVCGEIESLLDTLPTLGLTYTVPSYDQIVDAVELLGYTGIGIDTDNDDRQDHNPDEHNYNDQGLPRDKPKKPKKSKQEKQLRKLIESKGLDVELCDDLKSVMAKAQLSFSNAYKRTKEDYHPTDDELAIINAGYSNTYLTPQDLFVFNLESADQDIDRDNESFSDQALMDMARLSLDKAFLVDHQWNTPNHIGKIFAATVEDGKLKQKVYLLNDPMNDHITKNLLAGIYNKVSVGFSSAMEDMKCMSCKDGTSIYSNSCPHQPGGMDEYGQKTFVNIGGVADYFEVSLVPIPAQRNAGIRRNTVQMSLSANPTSINPNQNSNNKSIATISSGKNNLIEKSFGEVNVPDPTILDSTTPTTEAIAPVETVETKEPDVFITAPVSENAQPVITQAVETPETVVEPVTAKTAESDVSVKKLLKALTKSVKRLDRMIATQQVLLNETNKTSEKKLLAVETTQKELDDRLKALVGVFELATTTTVENLERQTAARKTVAGPQTPNSWAADLSKQFRGGR